MAQNMRSLLLHLCVLLLVYSAAFAQSQDGLSRLVHTTQGPVRGYKDPDGDIFNFYNIPYATAPNGVNRFKAPLPPPVWMQPFEAVDRGIICPQGSGFMVPGVTNMREDCLVANVFVPDTEETNLPVVIYVHGGSFQFGYGNRYQFKSLLSLRNVIMVTFNYRVGVHGFLCLGTKDVPGNAGMKDQVALLRWVKANIGYFGGNPDDVTLSGCSAGAGSLDALSLSKMTSGLYNKAIYETGAMFGDLGARQDPIEYAKLYASALNFTEADNFAALEQFFLTSSLESIAVDTPSPPPGEDFPLFFPPCVERDAGEEIFLDEAPMHILEKGEYHKLPLLYGVSNREGLFRLAFFNEWKDRMNAKFSDFLPGDLRFDNEEEKEKVGNHVKTFYFGNQPISEDSVLAYIDYFTDIVFAYPTLKPLKWRLGSHNDTIYLYEYNFVDDNTPLIPNTNEPAGALHCALGSAVLDEDVTDKTEEYINMKTTMRSLWLNFIINGNPAPEGSSFPEWPRADAVSFQYMSLGRTIELKRDSPFERRMRFWNIIYEEYYSIPEPPNPPPITDSAVSQRSISINLTLFLLASFCFNFY